MQPFTLSIPTRIYFGNDIKASFLAEKNLHNNTVLIVTSGTALTDFGHMDTIKEAINATSAAKRIVEYNQISPNPKLHEVEAGILFGIAEKVDFIIGFGGGSALDAAKAIAIGLGEGGDLSPYLFDGKSPTKKLPLILIPTTAGTGSELSQGAIITCENRKQKVAIRGSQVYPDVAIVDPSFTLSLPHKVTMETGFDVITHAVESFISKMATPFSEALSQQALKMAVSSLRILATDLSNYNAREQLSYSAMIMGINLGNVGTALPHRMQYPVGAITDTSHASGLAALYPAWIKHGYEYSPDKWNSMGQWVSGASCCKKQDVVTAFKNLLHELGLSCSLKNLGVSPQDLDVLINGVTGNITNDPASQKNEIIRKIYGESM